ncbi:hypothetical protein L915_03238 [Phytophthora nicotianae]|uniref:Uncharacterized protein n=1 Tax=Phytophthora nicotianae TaxID=4792 RepID=W2NXT6_PHYNI|nr:hypothetical protein L915_03238 [Phytophthora nicotianae]ETM53280.1 hypothetical protein L914_03229 [Phytophthora nicotianae]
MSLSTKTPGTASWLSVRSHAGTSLSKECLRKKH